MAKDTERKEYGAIWIREVSGHPESKKEKAKRSKKKFRLKHKCPEGRKETQLFQPTRTNR
jgi:hypothetical protein